MTCNDCGKKGLMAGELNYEVVGFERDRKQGGTNALAARKRTGVAVCDPCLALRKNPLARGQEGLL